MSSWGLNDDVISVGTVALAGLAVTGTNTFFANNNSVGQVITIAGAGGDAVIGTIANNTSLTLTSNNELTSGTLTGAQYTVSDKPAYVVDTMATMDSARVFGVDTAEQGVATANTNHAGWAYIGAEYTDSNSNTRQKTEVLVAMSSIASDADDDDILPDS
jgi:hypothetical protein